MTAVILLSRGGYGHTPREDLDQLINSVSASLNDAKTDAPSFVIGAFVNRGAPSLPDALHSCAEQGATKIVVLPLFVPSDKNLQRWLAKVMVRWHSTWDGAPLVLQIWPALAEHKALGEAITSVIKEYSTDTSDLIKTAPPRWEHNPAGWSYPPPHSYHLLLCQGPRCTANGATDRWQELRNRLRKKNLLERKNGALPVTTDCLFPCNHGPVMIVHPDNAWYSVPSTAAVDTIVTQHIENKSVAQEHLIQP